MAGILTFNILARIGRVRGAGGNRLVLPRHRLSFEDSYMTRKSLRFWLVPLLLGPACALALEIGEIQVSSALNQLFDARIPLLALTPEESEKVSVSLASKAMFKEFGLERTSALTNLVFSIEYNAEGLVYVRAVSTQPIREPSLGLLLEFNWPRGKTFREFTVFLDPVQRLAKRPSDRTKTVLTAPEPVPAAPVAAPPVAATAPPTPPVAAPIVAPPSSEQTESSAESLPVAVSPARQDLQARRQLWADHARRRALGDRPQGSPRSFHQPRTHDAGFVESESAGFFQGGSRWVEDRRRTENSNAAGNCRFDRFVGGAAAGRGRVAIIASADNGRSDAQRCSARAAGSGIGKGGHGRIGNFPAGPAGHTRADRCRRAFLVSARSRRAEARKQIRT